MTSNTLPQSQVATVFRRLRTRLSTRVSPPAAPPLGKHAKIAAETSAPIKSPQRMPSHLEARQTARTDQRVTVLNTSGSYRRLRVLRPAAVAADPRELLRAVPALHHAEKTERRVQHEQKFHSQVPDCFSSHPASRAPAAPQPLKIPRVLPERRDDVRPRSAPHARSLETPPPSPPPTPPTPKLKPLMVPGWRVRADNRMSCKLVIAPKSILRDENDARLPSTAPRNTVRFAPLYTNRYY